MTQPNRDLPGLVTSIFWRRVTLGDFFNIERAPTAGPSGGGGQLYIDIPLGGAVSIQAFGSFLSGQPLDEDDSRWSPIDLRVFTASTPIAVAPLTLTPRRGKNRRYRIANQNRQAAGAERHPAWTAVRGFPEAPDDVSSRNDPRMPDLSHLKVFIALSDLGDYYAGYTNAKSMPSDLPRNIGLEVLFSANGKVDADGMIDLPPENRFTTDLLAALVAPPVEQPIELTDNPGLIARVVRRSNFAPRIRDQERESSSASTERRSDPSEAISITAPRAAEAEDWVESRLKSIYRDSYIQRIGHTSLERTVLEDGHLPGADLIVHDSESKSPERFVEVKSASGATPISIRLTASELKRAKVCAIEGLPFDIWIVAFGNTSPVASIISNFEQEAAILTIEDLLAVDIQISS